MKNITFEAIDPIIRSVLISQSQLSQNFVRNAFSTYGTALDKTTSTDVFETLTPTDCVIFFMTSKRQSIGNQSIAIELGKVIQAQAYSVKVMIYGDDGCSLATALVARLRSEPIRALLYDAGIYLEEISETDTIYEFKNSASWLRTDFTINIACEHLILPITDEFEYDTLNTLKTYGS